MKKNLILILLCISYYSVAQQNALNSTGNVGVGTLTPQTLLNIVGVHGTTKLRLTLPAAANGLNTGEINLQTWVSEPGMTWDGGGIGMNVDNNTLFPRINTTIGQSYIRFIPNGGAMKFVTTNNTGTIFPSLNIVQGNVGIGTENPLQTLHVNGNEIFSTGSGAGYKFRDRNSVNSDDWAWFSQDNIAKFWRSGFGDIMTINTTGMMGIGGIPQSGYKLAVNGSIKAKEVKVSSLNWADFVFANEYQLPPLSEVETFIKINKHLPEIPSEKEVLEKGINLGEMNVKLLQKIEELTLYIIEEKKLREKEVKDLIIEIDLLKKKN